MYQEWTCDAKLNFDANVPSVTETTDVVLELGTGRRLATGAFVGVADGRVPASLQSTLVRHRGNVLVGQRRAFLGGAGSHAGNDAAVHQALAVGSDWLDGLPMADGKNLSNAHPVSVDGTRCPGRAGARVDVTIKATTSVSALPPITIDACQPVVGSVPLCTTVTSAASSPEECASACVLDATCVDVHQTGRIQRTHRRGPENGDVTTQSTCELYPHSRPAALSDRATS